MQITTDQPAYDALQRYLVGVITDDVRETLHEAAASGASLEEAVQAITLGFATILDGCRALEHDGRPIAPVLMFGDLGDGDALTDIVSNGGLSCLHEHLDRAAVDATSGADAASATPDAPDEPPMDAESELAAAYAVASGRASA